MSTYLDSIQSSTAASPTSSTDKARQEQALNKDDFLKLLVAQLSNQDPLNPDDATEFTSQLTQYSSLEQMFNLNDSMESLVAAYQSNDKLTALSTIGKEVAYNSNALRFEGESTVIGYQLSRQAADVKVLLQKDGATVATLEGKDLSAGTHYITWDGMANNGDPAATGNYTVKIQATSYEGKAIGANSIIRSEVTGVDLEGIDGGTLITASGSVSMKAILGVFETGTSTNTTTSEENG